MDAKSISAAFLCLLESRMLLQELQAPAGAQLLLPRSVCSPPRAPTSRECRLCPALPGVRCHRVVAPAGGGELGTGHPGVALLAARVEWPPGLGGCQDPVPAWH